MKIFIIALLLAIGYAQTDCNQCKADFLKGADKDFPKTWCQCLDDQNKDTSVTCRAFLPISCGDKGVCNSIIFKACQPYVPGLRHDKTRNYNIGLLDLFSDCGECQEDFSADPDGIFPKAYCDCLELQNKDTKERCRTEMPRSCGPTNMCDSYIFDECRAKWNKKVVFDNSRTYNMGPGDCVIDCDKCQIDFMKANNRRDTCQCLSKQTKNREETCQAVVPASCGDVDMCNPHIFDACQLTWDNSQHFNIGPDERAYQVSRPNARSGSPYNLQSSRSHDQQERENTAQLDYRIIIFVSLGSLALIILAIGFCWYVQQRKSTGLRHNLLLDNATTKEENTVSDI